MLHTLLLNYSYECINFLPERKVFKLLAKGKVEVISEWDEKICFWDKKKIGHPAIIRLKYHVRWIPRKIRYSPVGVFRRDQHRCQYCGKFLPSTKLTIDHVLPKSRGGKNSWLNCTTSCFECNNLKGCRLPEEANMKLLRKPYVPQVSINSEFQLMKNKHSSWVDYIIDK